VIAFGLAWPLFVLPIAFGSPGATSRQAATMIAWAAAMWAPGIGAIVATRLVAGEPIRTLGLRRIGPRSVYLWVWILPIIAAIVTGLLTVLLGAGHLDLEFTAIREAMARAPGGDLVAPSVVVAAQTAFAFTLAPLFNVVFALGEELGWRGFLLPRLLPFGQTRAIALSSAIWGIWHAPAILQGHNYPSQPVLGVFLMIGFCLLLGTFLSWAYLSTRSPWAPALGHATINATAGLPLLFVHDVDLVIGGTTASIIGWIPLALILLWLLVTHRLPVPDARPEAATRPSEQPTAA
jgi:membrane protease YdiL (CAAX protease family)